jgi:hypothetical protein
MAKRDSDRRPSGGCWTRRGRAGLIIIAGLERQVSLLLSGLSRSTTRLPWRVYRLDSGQSATRTGSTERTPTHTRGRAASAPLVHPDSDAQPIRPCPATVCTSGANLALKAYDCNRTLLYVHSLTQSRHSTWRAPVRRCICTRCRHHTSPFVPPARGHRTRCRPVRLRVTVGPGACAVTSAHPASVAQPVTQGARR